MIHFEFRAEHNNDENYQTFVSFEAETLDEVLENFTLFLRGAGYYVEQIVHDLPPEQHNTSYVKPLTADQSLDW